MQKGVPPPEVARPAHEGIPRVPDPAALPQRIASQQPRICCRRERASICCRCADCCRPRHRRGRFHRRRKRCCCACCGHGWFCGGCLRRCSLLAALALVWLPLPAAAAAAAAAGCCQHLKVYIWPQPNLWRLLCQAVAIAAAAGPCAVGSAAARDRHWRRRRNSTAAGAAAAGRCLGRYCRFMARPTAAGHSLQRCRQVGRPGCLPVLQPEGRHRCCSVYSMLRGKWAAWHPLEGCLLQRSHGLAACRGAAGPGRVMEEIGWPVMYVGRVPSPPCTPSRQPISQLSANQNARGRGAAPAAQPPSDASQQQRRQPARAGSDSGMPQVGPSRHSFLHEGRTIYEWDQTLRCGRDCRLQPGQPAQPVSSRRTVCKCCRCLPGLCPLSSRSRMLRTVAATGPGRTPALRRRSEARRRCHCRSHRPVGLCTADHHAPPTACCSEVNIYIRVPDGVGAKQLDVHIARQHLTVGIKGLPPYLDVRFWNAPSSWLCVCRSLAADGGAAMSLPACVGWQSRCRRRLPSGRPGLHLICSGVRWHVQLQTCNPLFITPLLCRSATWAGL